MVKMISTPRRRTFTILGAVVLLAISAIAFAKLRTTGASAGPDQPALRPPASVLGIQDAFVQVAKRVMPAVVSITSRKTIENQGFNFPNSNFFQQFGFPAPQIGPQHFTQVASGSGFIVRSDGYILTNDHVVNGATKVTVRLSDGREFQGKVIPDFSSDLAIVKIPADNLPTVQLADSSKVSVGQWALAFGSPFRMYNTMTAGIISARGRHETIPGDSGTPNDVRFYPDLLQTDAPINPGNSGGPLVNVYGQVVGVDVAIESPTGTYAGIGFAIPSNIARNIMDQLITHGKVTRGFLGVVPKTVTANDSNLYGVSRGALIAALNDNTPASQAGIHVQDVITRFGNKPINNAKDLYEAVANTHPGTTVQVTIVRNHRTITLPVTVELRPKNLELSQNNMMGTSSSLSKLGIAIADNSSQLAQRFNLSTTTGVVITQVLPGSPAQQAGLQAGDIIERFDQQSITSAAQLQSLAKKSGNGNTVTMVIRRGNQRMLVQITTD